MSAFVGFGLLLGGLVGEVTYYAPHVMEATYRQRLEWGHVKPCPDCVGMVALLDPAHLGRKVWLTRPGHPPEGPFLVVDCAARKDRERLRRRGLVAEVDNATARRWGMRGPLFNVRITFEPPKGDPWSRSRHPSPMPQALCTRSSSACAA